MEQTHLKTFLSVNEIIDFFKVHFFPAKPLAPALEKFQSY